jgi:hypothetical protein
MLGRVSALKTPHQRLFVVTLLSLATASSLEEAVAFLSVLSQRKARC